MSASLSNAPPERWRDERTLSARLTVAFDVMAASGLREAGHWHLLALVCGETIPRNARQIGRRLGMKPHRVTRAVDVLADRGLVKRVTQPADRRASLILPTAAGFAVVRRVRAAFDRGSG